jgi:hypothetical protein
MIKPSAMPKFSWMKHPGRARSARSRTSGCSRCPPLWITRSEDRSYSEMAGSSIHRISSAGTRWMCVTRCRWISSKTSRGRVLVPSTTVPPDSRKPCIPGQPSGRLCSIGSTSSSTSPSPISHTAAAIFELYR